LAPILHTDGVDQALVWECGAIGRECRVSTPNRTSWRFPHLFGRRTPWFLLIELFHQAHDSDWRPVIEKVAERLLERLETDVNQRQLQAAD